MAYLPVHTLSGKRKKGKGKLSSDRSTSPVRGQEGKERKGGNHRCSNQIDIGERGKGKKRKKLDVVDLPSNPRHPSNLKKRKENVSPT